MSQRLFRRLLVIFAAVPLLLSAGDERPVIDDSQVKKEVPASALPTLWIAGDSTVKNQGTMRGWGQDIAGLLDTTRIQVVNRAIGGRSSRTFFTEGRWDDMLKTMKTGDIVLVQFGHNDVGALDERGKFRGSVKGIGEETEEVKKPDGSTETVHSFGWYLKHYARTAKAKGATVVLCSPIPHKKFDREGKFVGDWDEWRGWVRDCATAEGVLYLDLSGLIGSRYSAMEKNEIEALFTDARTHTNAEGAKLNAQVVIDGLKALPGNPLEKYLPKAAATPP